MNKLADKLKQLESAAENADPDKTLSEAESYAVKAGKRIANLVMEIKEMFAIAKRKKSVIVVLVAALLYLLIPFDAIADIIPIAGFTDDAVVISGALALARKMLKSGD